jgi:hypothetical protein
MGHETPAAVLALAEADLTVMIDSEGISDGLLWRFRQWEERYRAAEQGAS